MRSVGVLEAKTNFSALVEEVERGGEIVVTKRGRPAIKLVKVEEVQVRPRKASAEEIVRMMQELHALEKQYDPDEPPQSWEELKELIRQ